MLHFEANRIAPARAAISGIAGCFVLLLTLTSCGVISARMYDNEKGAIAEVRTIQTAQTRYFAQSGRWARSLKELESAHMIATELLSGHRAVLFGNCGRRVGFASITQTYAHLLHHVGGSCSFPAGCNFENGLVTRFLSAGAELEVSSAGAWRRWQGDAAG